jgi:hypothetical protein
MVAAKNSRSARRFYNSDTRITGMIWLRGSLTKLQSVSVKPARPQWNAPDWSTRLSSITSFVEGKTSSGKRINLNPLE